MAETSPILIPWPRLRQHLQELRARVHDQMDTAGEPELWRLQGESRLLRKLGNLPETLALLDQDEENRA